MIRVAIPLPSMLNDISQAEITDAEKRTALDFALKSESLSRSDRLKGLLTYVCEAEFAGRAEQLTEYEIAVSALGRRSDFSPVEDSAVRSRTYELRQKLEKLYAVEAPQYPVRIDLPKGSYRPKFHRHVTVVPEPVATTPIPEPAFKADPKKSRVPLLLIVSFLAGVALASVVILLVRDRLHLNQAADVQQNRTGAWTPELRELWAPLTNTRGSIIVAFETRLFVSFNNSALVIRDPNVENMQDVESSSLIMKIKRVMDAKQLNEFRRYSDFSVGNALFSLGQLLSTSGVDLKAERSPELSIDDIHRSNLVLLGKPGAFDGVRGIPSSSFSFSYRKEDRSFRNLHPEPGELDVYERKGDAVDTGGVVEEYGVITMTPGTEKGQHVLNISSGESELFWPLTLCVTDPVYSKQLVDYLRLPSGRLPESYEVLVKIQVRDLMPVRITYTARRILHK